MREGWTVLARWLPVAGAADPSALSLLHLRKLWHLVSVTTT
jgi:hypothetical protein